MTFLDKLESRFGSLAISNIAAYLVLGQVAIFILSLGYIDHDGSNALFERMYFDSTRVLEGEIWRIFAFPLIPPMQHPIFLIFAWYIFYLMAGALESQWGAFRLNLYLLVGAVMGMASGFLLPGESIGNGVWGMTVFFAFAYLFPDFELRLFFVLPVKVRWLGWIFGGMLGFLFIGSPWQLKVFILASVSNFFLFFGKDMLATARSKKRISNLKAEKAKMEAEPFHTCSQCGATDKSHPERDFRYRSDTCICDDCLNTKKQEQ
jgi:hypothetical protein